MKHLAALFLVSELLTMPGKETCAAHRLDGIPVTPATGIGKTIANATKWAWKPALKFAADYSDILAPVILAVEVKNGFLLKWWRKLMHNSAGSLAVKASIFTLLMTWYDRVTNSAAPESILTKVSICMLVPLSTQMLANTIRGLTRSQQHT